METGKYNAFNGRPVYVPNPRYLELVDMLLNRKLSHDTNDFAPLPVLTVGNDKKRPHNLPGDLTSKTDQEIAATLCCILGNVPPTWNKLGEDERCPWLENAITKRDGESRKEAERLSARLTVDLACKSLTLDGNNYNVSSERALRWVKILVDHSPAWVSSSELGKIDRDLCTNRTDKLKSYLPPEVLNLIDSQTGAGSRINLRK